MYSALEELEGAEIPKPIVSATLRDRDKTTRLLEHYYTKDVPYTSEWKVRVTGKARVSLNTTFWDNFLARHGLLNIAALSWELIPFSFVVDWWINVGEVLTSLDSALFINSLTGYISTSIEEKCESGGGTFRYIYKSRSPTPFPLTASFVYDDSISLTHILNGLALWRGLFR